MHEKRITGGAPICLFVVKNNKQYPEISQLQSETARFYDTVSCIELTIDKISDLDIAITDPDKSVVVLLTKELMASEQVKYCLQGFKERNIKVIMYPVKVVPDSYYSVAHNMQDIHKTIYDMKRTFGASQQHGLAITSPITSSLDQIPPYENNYGLPSMPAYNPQMGKVPVYVLQSSNNDFGKFANAFVQTYKNNPQVDIRPIKNLNELSQREFRPNEQPVLIVSNAEVNKITPQLNMFRTGSQTKVHTVVYKNQRTQIPPSYNLIGNTQEDMNKHITQAIAVSFNSQLESQYRPNSPINNLIPNTIAPQLNKMIGGQSGVGSASGGRENSLSKTPMKSPPSVAPSVGSRATSYKPSSYKPSGKIRMKSARKVSPAKGAISQQCILMVCDVGQNQQFTQLHRSIPYPSEVVTEIPKDLKPNGPKIIIFAPYELRQFVLGRIPRQFQNVGVVFYASNQIAPDMIIKHRWVDLCTNNPQDIAQYFKQQNFRSMNMNNPNLPHSSMINMSGINSVLNSQNAIRSNIRTMQWQTQPTGPGVFYTTSFENRHSIPQINRSAYQNQVIRPSAMGKSQQQNMSLQYPASIQTINPYAQKPVADALSLFIADIKSQNQLQAHNAMVAQMPNPLISQAIANTANRNMLEELVISPKRNMRRSEEHSLIHPQAQVVQTKTVRRQIIDNPMPMPMPMPMIGPSVHSIIPNIHQQINTQQSGVQSSQAYRERSMEESEFEKRNTARFNSSIGGPHQWTVEKQGDFFQTANDNFPINNQRLMSFKNKNLDSNIREQIKYQPTISMPIPHINDTRTDPSFQNKKIVNPMIPVAKSFAPLRTSNIDLFTYQGNRPHMQWDIFRNPQNSNTFRLCPHQIYESLPHQQKFMTTNQLLLQSQNHPYNLSQIPTVSKLSKMERPSGNALNSNIARTSANLLNSGKNQLSMNNPNQMQWSAQRRGQPEYTINNVQQTNNRNQQYNQQIANEAIKGMNQRVQRPITTVTTTTNHRRILTNSEEEEILYDLNNNKQMPNRMPTTQNPIFPTFGTKPVTQFGGKQKTIEEIEEDKHIAAMIFNNNYASGREGNYASPLNDSGLEEMKYLSKIEPINYQPVQPIQPIHPVQHVPSIQQIHYSPNAPKRGLSISQTRQPAAVIEQINYGSPNMRRTQNQYFPEKRASSPLRVNKPPNLQIRVDPTFSPNSFNNNSSNNYNQYLPRQRKQPQIQRQVVQVTSTPQQNRAYQNYNRIEYQKKYDGSAVQTIVNNLRQSKSLGDEISNGRLSRQLAGSKSGKKGIINTVIDNNAEHLGYHKQFDAGKYEARNQNGILMYSRKRNFMNSKAALSPKVETSNRFGSPGGVGETIQYQQKNIIPTKDYGQSNTLKYTSNYNTIMNRAIDQPIQIVFRRSDEFMHQVANGFQHPPFQIQKYNSPLELQALSTQLSLHLMTVLVTDQIPQNVQKVFSNFSNFNCVVVPHDKLYKQQQTRYPTFKWITENNPTTVIYKIRDYLNRYNYVGEIPTQRLLKTPDLQSLTVIPKNINILISEVLKDKILLDPMIQHQVFNKDKASMMLDRSKTNVIIVEQQQVEYVQKIVRQQDKILVLQRENQLSPLTSTAQLSTKNPAAILGYITRLLKQSGGAITMPQVFYYFDEIDLEQTIQKRLGGRVIQTRYHDQRSLIRKLKQSGTSLMILIIGNEFLNQVEQIRRLQPNSLIIQYKPLQPLPIPNSVVAKSIQQVINELQRFR